MKVLNLYVGEKKQFGNKGEFSGIDKQPVDSVIVDENGITTDEQVDKRFHGGPEKAIHQFSILSYEKIAKQFPLMHKNAQLGSAGENLIAEGMNETNVFIGDIYQIGDIKVQVSAPRIPCWKVSEKLDMPGLDKFLASKGICGWYYRVLEGGALNVGDSVTLLDRIDDAFSVKHMLQIHSNVRTDLEEVKRASQAQALDPEWQEKLVRRYAVRKEAEQEKAASDYTL